MKNKHSTLVLIKHTFLHFLAPYSKTAGAINSTFNRNLPLVVSQIIYKFQYHRSTLSYHMETDVSTDDDNNYDCTIILQDRKYLQSYKNNSSKENHITPPPSILTESSVGSQASQCQEYPLCLGVFFIGGSKQPK